MSSRSLPERAALPPPATLAIHLDLVGGLSGDMFVAALADALPALRERVLNELAAAQPAAMAKPEFRETASGSLRALGFGLARAAPAPSTSASSTPPAHVHDVASAPSLDNHHAGTAYGEIRGRLAAAPLQERTRVHALALLALLAEAEARVHGIVQDDVHFHELADWDSLLDVVAAGAIAGALEGAQWTASAPPLGGGTVRTAHGLLPVPAPATTQLLVGYPWLDDGIGGERVTPTGAAILRHLVPVSACGTQRGSGRLLATGQGAGTRVLPGVPNIVRALVFDRAAAAAIDAVVIIEFDVDDMSGEEIGVAVEHLRAEAGVIDVSIGTRVGKKGRPVVDFRLLARPHAADAVARACFGETSTLGLRWREEHRRVLARAEIATTVDGSDVRVKVAERPDGRRTAKTAHDDVAARNGLAARRRLRAAGEKRVLSGDDE